MMENTHTSSTSKIITICFMLAALLVGIFVSIMMDTLAAVSTGAFGRFVAQDLMRHGLPVVAGLITFVVLQFTKKIVEWADEVVTELRRVVWPSARDTTSMTVVVCIMLLISGVVFGVLDVVSGSVIDWLLHQNFFGIFG